MKKRYVIVPERFIFDMDISGNDLKVLCFFIKYSNFVKDLYFSIGYIAKRTNIAKRTVQSSLANLKHLKIISWQQRRMGYKKATNLYTLHKDQFIQKRGKICHEVNTNNLLTNNIKTKKVDKTKYVSIEKIQYTLTKIRKMTNIHYRKKVKENSKMTTKQQIERKAWIFISEMDKTKREQLLKTIGTDQDKWDKFLEQIKPMLVYNRGRIRR